MYCHPAAYIVTAASGQWPVLVARNCRRARRDVLMAGLPGYGSATSGGWRTASAWRFPAAIWVAPDRPLTWTGAGLEVRPAVVPLPSSPS
jgi:hypothetical protein